MPESWLLPVSVGIGVAGILLGWCFGLLVLFYQGLARAAGDILDSAHVAVGGRVLVRAGRPEQAASLLDEWNASSPVQEFAARLHHHSCYLKRLRRSKEHYAKAMAVTAGVGAAVMIMLFIIATA